MSRSEVDAVRAYTAWATQELPGSEAGMYIQWKGTDVCLDFYCKCGKHCHYDGYFAYVVQCPSCDRVYELGQRVIARQTNKSHTDPVIMTVHEHEGDE
jgi:hypothetical protein